MERFPEQDQRKSRLGAPPDSDLIGIPVVLGVTVAVLAILAAFFFIGWVGLIVLVVVLVAALAISYRVVTGAENED
ncbi:MAG: hypothetical protein ACRDK5_03255 [Solirubrobacterales bacterium]